MLEAILSLQKLAYRSEAEIYDDFTIPPLTQTLEGIKKDFERQIFLKAVTDGRIIGSVRAFVKEGTCYVGRLIVHPDFQNQGIGTQLMAESRRILKRLRGLRFLPAIRASEIFTSIRSWDISLLKV